MSDSVPDRNSSFRELQPTGFLELPGIVGRTGRVRVGTQIGLAFACVALVIVVSTLVSNRQVERIAESTTLLREQHQPTTQASLTMLNGVNASLVELREWILLGQPESRKQRAEIWEQKIQPALDQLTTLSRDWTAAADVQRRDRIVELTAVVRDDQVRVEALANTPENLPAHEILNDELTPLTNTVMERITEMIDAEQFHEVTFARRRLLKNMANFRDTMSNCVSHLRAYLLSADDRFKKTFNEQWLKNGEAFTALARERELLTLEQASSFSELSRASVQWEPLARRMFEIRDGAEWNRAVHMLGTKLIPESRELRGLLDELVDDRRRLMHNAEVASQSQIADLKKVQWTLLVFGLVASVCLGIVLTRTTASPFRRAVLMADAIATGNFESRPRVGGSFEAVALEQALSNMARQLESRLQQSQQAEERMSLLTDELQSSNAQLQDAAAIQRTALDTSKNFMGLMKVDGTLIDGNRTALDSVGMKADEVFGRLFWETPWWTHSTEQQERLKQATATAAAGVADGFEATHFDHDGNLVIVDFALTPVKNEAGKVVYLIPEGRNITTHRQREAEQMLLAAKLEASNAELAQFAYVASHDLQEPLRKVSSFCQLLNEEYGEKIDDDGKEYLGYIVDGATRMRSLIQDLLSYSRVESQGAPLQDVDVDESLRNALSNLAGSIEDSDAVITHDELPVVQADPRQLTQLFQNLIGNGIKYCETSPPEISIRVEDRENDWLFSVADNGIGIDPRFHDKIFGIFKRLHTRTEYSGTGIGLAICKRIVDRLEGKLWIESEAGQGSTFYFTVPKNASH